MVPQLSITTLKSPFELDNLSLLGGWSENYLSADEHT